MRSHNPTTWDSYLKTLQSASNSLNVSKVFTSNNGTTFFNSFRGSKIEEGVSPNFKSNDHSELSISQVQEKYSGTYTVQGCIKWLGESENHRTRYDKTKKLRESILYDGSNRVLLTIWESLLKMNLKELKQWYTFTDVNVKNYFDRILRTTIHTNESETETDAPLLHWSRVDVKTT